MATTLFVVSLVALIICAIVTVIFQCLWVYRDAEVKSEQEPSLWVLIFIFLSQPLAIIIYFLVGRTKKDVPAPGTHKVAAIASMAILIAITIFFTVSTISFARDHSDSGAGFGQNATMSNGVWMVRTTNYRNNVWRESVRSGRGTSRRTHTLNAEQMRNFLIDSINEEGSLYLQLEQGNDLTRIDISGDYYRLIDLHNYGFLPGRIRMTLIYESVRNSETIISWATP